MKTTIIIAFVIITLMTEGRVAQQYECVEFDLEQLAKPCSIYNPSSLAYLDTSSQTLEEALTAMNSYITGIVAYGSVFQECAPWSTWYCQNPSLTDGKPPPLRSCGVDDNGQAPPTPTPIPTCRTMCEGFLKACRASYQAMGPAFGSLVPKSFCNSFSNDGVTVDGVHIPCWNVTPTYTPPTGNITCPEYTRKSPDGHCQPQCPSPEYTKDQVFHLGLMQQIVGWISFVVALILSVFFVVRKELRSFPTRMILFLLLGSMGLSLAFMLATFVGGNVGDVWCGDHDSYSAVKLNADDRSINDEGLCVFQGWNIILGTLLLSFWWAALSFNTALIIHAGLDYALFETQKHLLEATYHVVCWGVPLALSIVAAAATKIDYEPSYAFCFISSSNNAAWQIGLWFVPVGLCLLVGLLCSLYSVLKIIGSQSAKLNPTYLAVTIRILCCVLFFFTVIVIIFTYVIFAAVQENNNAIALVLYLICLLSGTIEESVCRETQLNQAQPFQTQYGLAAAATFFMAAAGVFLSLFFGTSDKVIRALRSTSSQDMPVSSFSSNNLDRDQS